MKKTSQLISRTILEILNLVFVQELYSLEVPRGRMLYLVPFCPRDLNLKANIFCFNLVLDIS